MDEDILDGQGPDEETVGDKKATRRKIPGGLPYTGSPGVFQRVLEKLPITEKPTVFNPDFLGTVLGATGGASRPIIPIMKATNLLSQSGTPTELYAQFQTEGGRAAAALQAMKNAYAEIFKRNQFAHKADENTLIDIIVSITGLPRSDKIVKYILNTFQIFQKYASSARDDAPHGETPKGTPFQGENNRESEQMSNQRPPSLGLVYNINIVLPETTNVEIYNAIFRSLRGNML
ncbi:MAG: hypothetical protein E6Q98_19755 [Rhodospirillaceae bacterium]|nr:MAG: hypothetical protein E6Q98_19755 [Rhodospirillaceae bacterium]